MLGGYTLLLSPPISHSDPPYFFFFNDTATTEIYTLSLHDALPISPDWDHDRVPDKRDACPNTPRGATVDPRGCPPDADHDGVHDALDQCPNTPAGATRDGMGCALAPDGGGAADGTGATRTLRTGPAR